MAGDGSLSAAILGDLFGELESRGIRYCVLRNFEGLPEQLGSRDVDILVEREAKLTLRRLVPAIGAKHGANLYNYFLDERLESFFFSRRASPREIDGLQIDFFVDTEAYGSRLLSGEDILAARVRYRALFAAAEHHRVLDKWLFNFIVGQPLPAKYHKEFGSIVERHRKEVETDLAVIFGEIEGSRLVETICTEGFEALGPLSWGKRMRTLFRAVLRAPIYHALHLPRFFLYRLRYLSGPYGESVSVSGPDGCGKSTVLAEAQRQLYGLFKARLGNPEHFRPNLLPRIARLAQRARVVEAMDEEYSAPHRGKPSGTVVSLIRFAYYLSDYILGHFAKIRPALTRRELVLFDRYYYDMVADPGRSRISLPLWVRKLALSIIPLPHTAFFVHVSPSQVRERKQELPVEKIEELNGAYQALVDSGRLLALENDSSAESAAATLVDQVLARRRRRLHLEARFPSLG